MVKPPRHRLGQGGHPYHSYVTQGPFGAVEIWMAGRGSALAWRRR